MKSPLEPMYGNMSYEELVREAENVDNPLAKALLEAFNAAWDENEAEARTFNAAWDENEAEARIEYQEKVEQFDGALFEMRRFIQNLVDDLVEAKGGKLKSKEAVQKFINDCEDCELMSCDDLELISILWDIKYEN